MDIVNKNKTEILELKYTVSKKMHWMVLMGEIR